MGCRVSRETRCFYNNSIVSRETLVVFLLWVGVVFWVLVFLVGGGCFTWNAGWGGCFFSASGLGLRVF